MHLLQYLALSNVNADALFSFPLSTATGKPDNAYTLPAGPYEAAFAIQDRNFKTNGELFYPAFEQDDPPYSDFIETPLPEDDFPCNGGVRNSRAIHCMYLLCCDCF